MEHNELARFISHLSIDHNTGCWNWIAASHGAGKYGGMGIRGKMRFTHRLSYEHFRGLIPEGLQIDHLCRNHKCCNPDHLEAVTPKENIRRGLRPNANPSHCRHGHKYTPENTYIRPNGFRYCKQCRRDKDKAWYRADPMKKIKAAKARYWKDPVKSRQIANDRYRAKKAL